MNEKIEKIYMTVPVPGEMQWEKMPQQYLGEMTWAEAVAIAKKQDCVQVRLCNSNGYNNQGHYIQTDKRK